MHPNKERKIMKIKIPGQQEGLGIPPIYRQFGRLFLLDIGEAYTEIIQGIAEDGIKIAYI
jgi:hypothetical protein